VSRRLLKYWPLALGLCLAGAAYLPRLGRPLAFDDRPVIEFNPGLEAPVPWSAFFSRDYFRFSGEASWRPLATLSYRCVIRLFGKSPAWLRASSLLLHALNALLLCALLLRLRVPRGAAAWASALWLVHPVHAETLMCASFNEDVLAAGGMLAMALAHLGGRPLAASAAFAWALLSKETGALGLLLAALLGGKKRHLAAYSALLLAWLGARFLLLKGPMSEGSLAAAVPLAERAFFGLSSLGAAWRLFIAPAALRIEYFALPPASGLEWLAASCGGAALALAALGAAGARPAGLRSLLIISLSLLAAVSGFVPAESLNTRFMAERFLYAPFLGFCACAAWFLRSSPAAAGALLAGWAFLAGSRAADWSREARLWQGLRSGYPLSAKAAEGLGQALFREGSRAGALEAFESALLIRERRLDPVLAYYAPKTQALRWESPGLRRWLGLSRMRTGDPAGAEREFEQALELDRNDAFSYRALAYLAALRGAFARAGELSGAGLARCGPDPVLERIARDARLGRLSFRLNFQ
jgi:tetratricopeptide (TPR) repeat protein